MLILHLVTIAACMLYQLQGAAEKCKFVVREVMDRPLLRYGVVTLESAIHPGWFVSVTSSGKTRRCKEPGLPTRVDETRFAIRVEVKTWDKI